MSEVKVFRVTGEIVKPNLRTTFKKEVRALKPENAKEKVGKILLQAENKSPLDEHQKSEIARLLKKADEELG